MLRRFKRSIKGFNLDYSLTIIYSYNTTKNITNYIILIIIFYSYYS
jgi:hypothetical protein